MSDQDVPASVQLIGGELPTWSDFDSPWPVPQPGAQFPVVAEALLGRSRILLAGPHGPELVGAVLSTGVEVTCLVRSIPDAITLAERFDGQKVSVACGSLERFKDGQFDAVVALDDVRRLYSPEGPEPTFANGTADLRRLLATDGVLVLAVENELGAHRLSAKTQPETDHSTPAWDRPSSADETRPQSANELMAFVGAPAAWPLYPTLSAPTVAWGPAAATVDRNAYAGVLAALSARAAEVLEHRPMARDPYLLLRRIWRAGRFEELASGWLVVAGATAPIVPPHDLIAHVAGVAEPIWCIDGVPRYGGGQPLPSGALVSDLLLQAVVAPDQQRLRAEIASYAAWLGTLAAPGHARADQVVRTPDGAYAFLALAPGHGHAYTADEQLVASVAVLVDQAERHGYRRTWPSYLTAPEAVAWVAAMRGAPVDQAVLDRLTAGLVATPAEAGARQHEESNASRARWFENKLATAEKQLEPLRKEIAKLKGEVATAKAQKAKVEKDLKALRNSRTVRIGRVVGAPMRKVRKALRGK
ncbi:hypothetical protein [Kribbella deserti]|uniref:Class I SAM-dependent methyltransferase n=1 Tax=Kribbella deserti TaxID=1926257 RepID=A0ABV6QFU9_9ACTN